MARNRSSRYSSKIATVLATLVIVSLMLGAVCKRGAESDQSVLSGILNITGSNTVTPLSAIWAEDFMAINPRVRIAVSGPGTGVGIAALISGTTDIAQASRKMSQEEIDQARAKGVQPYETTVALDALSVVVNPANSVSSLTIGQLSGIYTGQITNWNQVGGNNAPIVALARDTNSGTHVYFKEHVVQMEGLPTADKSLEYGPKVLYLPSTEEGVSQVATNRNAIFYAGLGYLDASVKALGVKRTAADPAIIPDAQTARDGTYPIARPLLFYTNGQPDGLRGAFIAYCLSPDGQSLVEESGYVPIA